jgi:hypothetical protein
MSIQAMKQALEALEATMSTHGFREYIEEAQENAIDSLRQAIAELESQEPVGRFAKFTDGIWREVTDYSAGVPLYTHPQQRTWVGLTDEEVVEVEESYDCWADSPVGDLVLRIETKLKEKNDAT